MTNRCRNPLTAVLRNTSKKLISSGIIAKGVCSGLIGLCKRFCYLPFSSTRTVIHRQYQPFANLNHPERPCFSLLVLYVKSATTHGFGPSDSAHAAGTSDGRRCGRDNKLAGPISGRGALSQPIKPQLMLKYYHLLVLEVGCSVCWLLDIEASSDARHHRRQHPHQLST